MNETMQACLHTHGINMYSSRRSLLKSWLLNRPGSVEISFLGRIVFMPKQYPEGVPGAGGAPGDRAPR
jgi:hypothetical protein